MLISRLKRALRTNLVTPTWTRPELVGGGYSLTAGSGQSITPDSVKRIATAYRCGAVLSDDIAKLPLQLFLARGDGNIQRIRPDGRNRNMAYVVEIQPNRYQTAFYLKKTAVMWLLYWGNAYIWMPPGRQRELFLLAANATLPYIAEDGQLWYRTTFSNGQTEELPSVEVLHLMINSEDGFLGRSVIAFARDTLGRRQGAGETQDMLYSQGLMPAAIMKFNGALSPESRQKIREEYESSMSGSANAYRLAILDNKVEDYKAVQISPVDAQFLQSIEATDLDIANFFGLPLYKLNMGKQSYSSNEQQALDYLATTLDPYLVAWEQAAQLHWLTLEEQSSYYWRFNRDALMRTDSKTRGEYLSKKVLSGLMTINEARAIEDNPSFPGGDSHYVPANMAVVLPDGRLQTVVKSATERTERKEEEH